MSSNYSAVGGMNRVFAGATLVLLLSASSAQAQPGWVLSHQKISDTQGGGPRLDNDDRFGISSGSLGDLDGDGVTDLIQHFRFDRAKSPSCLHILDALRVAEHLRRETLSPDTPEGKES